MGREEIISIIIGCFILLLAAISQTLIFIELSPISNLDFCDEDIIVTFNGSIANVYARYGLKNRGDQNNYPIILPFASKPWNINLTLDGEHLDYYWTSHLVEEQEFSAISFRVNISKGETRDVNVIYERFFEIYEKDSQTFGRFKYLVGTTKSWGEPLDYAHFEFWTIKNDEKQLLDTFDFENWLPDYLYMIYEFEIN
ncbi:MAG: hypothetical protein GF308_07100 [Candidatus Heimdallarchaeota archaeon]|nr:hypothetical protein [Candidatus Heimdallarchaeota archaeon]